jgi:hypothetical protein
MTDFAKIRLPRHDGPIDVAYLELVFRELLAKADPRYPRNDFADAFVAHSDGTATIGADASVTTQKSLPMVNVGGRASAQNIQPLSSSGSASTAAIHVAAHTLRTDYGLISYGSGTISGLTPSVEYHVYSDDNYTGGAVTYSATTDRQTIVAARNRYHVGSIVTAISSTTGNISAASSANPVEITSAGHGLSSGQSVNFADLPGDFAALNGNTYVVTVTGSGTFTVPVDGSGFAAYGSGGSWARVSTPTGGRAGGGWDYYGNYAEP